MDGQRRRFASRLRPLRGLSDEELTAAVAAGDRRAFGFIFERYHERLYLFCAGMLGDGDRAVDALQRTMLGAMRGLKAADPQIPLQAWLYRIANRESLALLEEGVAAPEDGLARQLRDLPVHLRAALLLHELGGLEHGEVAAALRISPPAARRSVREAREALDPGGVRSGARRAQRVSELGALFALPRAVTEAVRAAGHAALGSEGNGDRGQHRVLVACLLLAVVVASVSALAALGTFDSGRGRGHGPGNAAGAPTPVQITPGRIEVSPAHAHGGPVRAPAGAIAPNAPTRTAARPGTSGPSAVSGYTTPGERTQNALGGE